MFISFEGLDGSGKSTQVRLLCDRLRKRGLDVELFREPGGTQVSETVRELLLDPAFQIDPMAELLLFSAARAQLVAERIVPHLTRGGVVICDRFFDSTTAYQGGGRSVADEDWLRAFHLHVTSGVVPRRTYLIELPPAEALRRRSDRDGDEDRMERAGEAFFVRAARAYRRLATLEPDRFLILDGTAPIEQIHERIWDDASQLLTDGTAP